MGLLDKLNNAQKQAVINTDGPIMVMAGAGSGKTRVLTHRIAYLVKELGIPLNDILAVTFTNKAAKEMKDRVAQLLDDESQISKMWVSTIHGLCYRILRRCMDRIPPFTKKFNIADDNDSLKYVKQALKELELDEFYKDKEMQTLISKSKNNEYINFGRQTQKQTHFEMIFDYYNRLLEKDNAIDFDDLLRFTIRIFKENKDILEYYQDKFQYVMIDEFQDTNFIQYDLIKMLAIKHQNIFIVGDQDQSIYAFRGAKVENIEKFQRDFPLTKIILLEQNYRSNKGILDLANDIISKNSNRIKKNLFTENSEKRLPIFYQGLTSYDEIAYIIFKMNNLIEKYDYKYSDFAIIYRANYLSRQVEDELVKRGIKYQIYGGMSFFSRAEVKDMIAYLSLIVNKDNDFAFKRIVNMPKRKIGNAILDKLKSEAEERKCSLFDAIDTVKANGTSYNNLVAFKFLILEINEMIEKRSIYELIDVILDKTGYSDYLKTLGEDGEDRLNNAKELKSILVEADEEYDGTNSEKLEQITQALTLRTDMDRVDEEFDSVRLMTYHQAKGLEFKVVFMIALEEGIFPSMNSLTDEEIAEERRVCYVGVTRAMERLYLTCAKVRTVFGANQRHIVSRFIDPESKLIKQENKKRKNDIIDKLKDKEKVIDADFPFRKGDKIEHKSFGVGLIVQVEKPLIVVAFKAPYGVKKLQAMHPSIRKI